MYGIADSSHKLIILKPSSELSPDSSDFGESSTDSSESSSEESPPGLALAPIRTRAKI